MRWKMGTGSIGGCGCHAVISGVVAEIGSVRTFDPINPCDIGPASQPPGTPPPFGKVNVNALAQSPAPYYPMTCHQRLYRWPDTGVGPVRCFGEPSGWGVSLPPVEVATGQTDWPLRPVTPIPIARIDGELPKWKEEIVTTTVLPQRGNSTREFWTFRTIMPWATTVFIRNVQLEGDTRHCYIRGVTRDNLGATLAGVTVRCLQSELVTPVSQANPICWEQVSDSAGNFNFGVRPGLGYELIAYHEGTNVGGISLDDLVADATVNIYCTTPGVAPPTGGGASPVFGDMTGGLK